jgi:hypothetical protein
MRGRHDGAQKKKQLIIYVCLGLVALAVVCVYYGSPFKSTGDSKEPESVKKTSLRRSVKDVDGDEDASNAVSVKEESNIRLKSQDGRIGAEESDFDVSLKSFPVSDCQFHC